MNGGRRAIEAGRMTPADIAEIREIIRQVLLCEECVEVSSSDGWILAKGEAKNPETRRVFGPDSI